MWYLCIIAVIFLNKLHINFLTWALHCFLFSILISWLGLCTAFFSISFRCLFVFITLRWLFVSFKKCLWHTSKYLWVIERKIFNDISISICPSHNSDQIDFTSLSWLIKCLQFSCRPDVYEGLDGKSDYSLFINFFFNSFKEFDYSLFLGPHYSLFMIFFGSLFTIHYKIRPLFTNHYTPSRPSSMCLDRRLDWGWGWRAVKPV